MPKKELRHQYLVYLKQQQYHFNPEKCQSPRPTIVTSMHKMPIKNSPSPETIEKQPGPPDINKEIETLPPDQKHRHLGHTAPPSTAINP